MFNTYASSHAALTALKESGLGHMDHEIKDVIGGLQPVVICDHIRDAEAVQSRGFNARLTNEFAAD